MTYSLPKPATYGFLFTAMVYLVLLPFIDYPLTTLFKPVPIVCLMAGILQSNMLQWARVLLILALGFSIAGDIVLTLPIKLVLELGIGAFLLAHCCYIALYLNAFTYRISHILYYIPVLIVVGFIVTYIIPHLGPILIPVLVYFCILMLMVFSAFQVNREGISIASGALFFLISDLTLALNLFVYPQIDPRVFVMFTYFAAQFLMTWGIMSIYKSAKTGE